MERGEHVRVRRIVFNDLDTLRSILTKERMRLMHYIRTEEPESIYELAKKVDRKWNLVAKDVELLNNTGLIQLERKTKPKGSIKPILNFDKINMGIMI